jgi:hypothetical protein
MKLSRLSIIAGALCAALFLSGCCTSPKEAWKVFAGTSTKSLESSRSNALVKIFGYDYGTCYVKTEELVKKIPKVSIYAKNEEMLAIYYNAVNNTPVGIFFTEVDASHTRVEVASPSPDAKSYVAKSVFAGKIQEDTDKLMIEVRQPVQGKY